MTKDEFNVNIWQFYLQLESDFCNTLRYVEFSEENHSTYSKEYARQLLSIGSEIDVVCKELCKAIDAGADRENINDYAKILCGYKNLVNAKISVNLTGENFTPFAGWTESNSPYWWKAYNKVKHNRLEEDNQQKGNLKNVLMALAGLFVLNRYLCRDICQGKVMREPEVPSKLFSMVSWPVCKAAGNGFVWVADCSGGLSMQKEND